MKAISILSALVFAHAALAQATDSSSSAAVLTTTSASVDTATSTAAASSTPVPTTSNASSSSADAPSSAAPSTTGTKKGSKSSSGAPTSTSNANNTAPTGGSSIWEDGTKTLTSTDGNPLMPAGVSAACSTYLSKMNKDTQLATCLTSVLTPLHQYTTSGSGSDDGTKAMTSLCASNACNVSVMRSALNDFADACRDDFASSDVALNNYDMMYSLIPLKSALCTKDPNTQSYCVLNAGSSSNTKRSASNIMYARDHLINTYVKRGSSQTVFVPNTDTYRDSNLMFMFNSPDMASEALCTECTKQIMSKYVAFESSTPHALGVAASPLLGGQVALWKSMQDKCPASYMSSVANAAGSPDVSSGASAVATGSTVTAFAGALAALVALI